MLPELAWAPMLSLILLTGLDRATAQLSFASPRSYPSGRGASAVIGADVNGDGRIDLVSLGATTLLSVLTNNGNADFGSNATYNVGAITSVFAADVNGDSKADLICANIHDRVSPGTLEVLTNDGHGGFLLSSSPVVGARPISVVAADVNRDGWVDLISANASDNTISVLTNDGRGSFVPSGTYAVGNDPFWVVAADISEDNWPDLICANYKGNNLSVLTNTGGGRLGLSSSPSVGSFPICLAAADVNGDGKMDLISANSGTLSGGNSLSVLTNGGNGVFALAATYAVGRNPCGVVAVDVNADGQLDLISCNFLDNTLTVLTNNGSGDFALALTCGVGVNPRGITAADVNGDGRADLISANFGDGSLSVLVNIPTLRIRSSSGVVVVSYPSSWTNWTLLQSTNLGTPAWSASAGVADDGTNRSLNVSSPVSKQFFRLSSP
jgi:hypothetical protein